MPGMTGLEVQAALNARGLTIPILFLTGHGDIPMAVRAVQAGAVDFLEKPIQGAALLERVQRALALDLEWRQTQGRAQAIQQRYARLSSRERECMALIASGLTSKEIARELGISPRTVEVHRTHVMHKMGPPTWRPVATWRLAANPESENRGEGGPSHTSMALSREPAPGPKPFSPLTPPCFLLVTVPLRGFTECPHE